MIPLRDEIPSERTPYVTRVLLALNVAAFLYEITLGPGLRAFVYDWGLLPARVVLAVQGGEPAAPAALTVFSSMFLHGGWAHLLGNMWYLFIFGDNTSRSTPSRGRRPWARAARSRACSAPTSSRTRRLA
jgi:membrane associated rhomboid family serine protease